jgi:hypothetical protein
LMKMVYFSFIYYNKLKVKYKKEVYFFFSCSPFLFLLLLLLSTFISSKTSDLVYQNPYPLSSSFQSLQRSFVMESKIIYSFNL